MSINVLVLAFHPEDVKYVIDADPTIGSFQLYRNAKNLSWLANFSDIRGSDSVRQYPFGTGNVAT
ncbi:hypothetical protein A8144_04185 [Mycobacterium leprae 3125609]|nr:hypothetical protein A8144_04185 [Mycobacterium leprae 3125609]OAX71853.1 hypothetical protein A3216_03485 [Mycobacterium leprae 7935681]